MTWFTFLCVCVIPSYISVSHAKKKKEIWQKTILACMFCFPKSGNSLVDLWTTITWSEMEKTYRIQNIQAKKVYSYALPLILVK